MLLKFITRQLLKHPFLNLVKIIGSGIALCGVVFIALFIKHECSYDSFHKKYERIYRLTVTRSDILDNKHFARYFNSYPTQLMPDYFPEVENFVRLAPMRGGNIVYDKKYYNITEAFFCDSTFFHVFDGKLLVGDAISVLNEPGAAVLSERFAKKIFGNKNPVGEVITLPIGRYYGENTTIVVKGIMADFPSNAHFHPEILASSTTGRLEGWAYNYLLLKPNTKPENITQQYPAFVADYTYGKEEEITNVAHLQPLADIHLHSNKLREIEPNGNISNIYVLVAAAIILLLVGVANYVNLNIGMSGFTDYFLSINKVLGSSSRIRLKHAIIENTLVLSVAVIVFAVVAIPINHYIKSFYGLSLVENNVVLLLAIIALFILLFIGAMLVQLLRNTNLRTGKQVAFSIKSSKKLNISSKLVISQNVLTICLIIAVLIIYSQTNYALKHSMGAQNDNILCFGALHMNVQDKFPVFKDELLKKNSIVAVSGMLEEPGGQANDMMPFELEGYTPRVEGKNDLIGVLPCDYSFPNLFGLEFIGGQTFTENYTDNEGSGEYIINETALKYLNYLSPQDITGKGFHVIASISGIKLPKGQIVGVVKDFHLSGMKTKDVPLVLFKRKSIWLRNVAIEYLPGKKQEATEQIQLLWSKMLPSFPLMYEELSTINKNIYKAELLQFKILSLFTVIAIFISSMGLLGISLLSTQNRIKEIGIRKVNGAKISEILTMLNSDFVKWVAIAFVIASPIAYYAMNKWLENFAYKTNLSWWIFALAGLLALGIALLTVSWQSWRAATRNPVEALRYE